MTGDCVEDRALVEGGQPMSDASSFKSRCEEEGRGRDGAAAG